MEIEDSVSTRHMSAASTPRDRGSKPRSCQVSPNRSTVLKKPFFCPDCELLRVQVDISHSKLINLEYKLRIQREKYEEIISKLEDQQSTSLELLYNQSDIPVQEDISVLNRLVVELQIYSADLRRENQALKTQINVFRELIEGKIEAEAVFRGLFAGDMVKLEESYRADIESLDLEYLRCIETSKTRLSEHDSLLKQTLNLIEKWRYRGEIEETEADMLGAKYESLHR